MDGESLSNAIEKRVFCHAFKKVKIFRFFKMVFKNEKLTPPPRPPPLKINLPRNRFRYIEVEQFGLCGEKRCGLKATIPNLEAEAEADAPCQELISDYAFYLALENSLCE